MLRSFSLISLAVVSLGSVAAADDAAPTTETAVAPAPTPPPATGPTLRNGFSLSVGEEFATIQNMSLSGQLYGVDWRIGAQINKALAVYLDTHMSFGTAAIGTASGVTGNFATAVVGEYMLPMRAFVGGGGGYGVLNNPNGPLMQIRAGWYPFEAKGEGKSRRLNVALDSRFYFVSDIGTVTQMSLTLGYDRF